MSILLFITFCYLTIGFFIARKLVKDLTQEQRNWILTVENEFVNTDTESVIGLYIVFMLIWPFITEITIEDE